ncbi:IclR family transcriptional regulator [Devosia sp.]|uniref:IclR family transcriptional regulator n=1 Tax=Devosia sp. TaxID=1871048 RepID=UPI002735FB0A|nr:helix-turn-helix domain-containing protein [Devosia sp.]MDP2779622.1 helix-turn-helix domain-containing protein [Devosia sp.]
MPTVAKSLGEGTQAALLTVAIIDRLAQSDGPVSVSDLAKEVGTSKSRIFRHLQTLLNAGIATRYEPGGQYGVGPKLVDIGRAINRRYDLVNLATSVMHDLRESFGHSVILSRVEHHGIEVLKSISGKSPIVLEIRPGTVLPFLTSAQGKLAMAVAQASLNSGTPLAAARATYERERPGELEVVRQAGISVAQMREGLNGVAAPIFGPADQIVGTIALLDTVADIGREIEPATIEALKSAAQRLSESMGTTPKKVS